MDILGEQVAEIVDRETKAWDTQEHWEGRVCKVYSKLGDGWKMTMHTGVLKY